jgi:predicted DNA-binding transcriptional regulator YafY
MSGSIGIVSAVRADRLLSILLLLDTHRHLTAGELARRLEVSDRTIYRDLDALSAAGIPVYALRGGRGGCYLPDGYRTNLTGLTQSEAQVLSLAGPAQVLTDLGLQHAAEAAQTKLIRALPAAVRHIAASAHERVLIEASGWDPPTEDVPHLEALRAAVWQERRLVIVYGRPDGTTVERIADPLGLVAKGSVWYLIAVVGGDVRVYRVARLVEVRVLDEPIARPPGFDLAAYWQQASRAFKASIPRVGVLARVAQSALEIVRHARRVGIEREQQAAGDAWVELSLLFDTYAEARAFLLSCGPLIEVLEPRELREEIHRLASETADLYARQAANRSWT